MKQFVTKNVNKANPLYKFICTREYVEGALTKPSPRAISIFTMAENVFQARRDDWKNCENPVSKFTERAMKVIEDTYSTMKTCHLKIIMSRFYRARLHFYARQETRNEIPKNAANIQSSTNASKSTAAKEAFR